MAGAVRQQIDLASLSTYLKSHVPEIKPPISIKQVGCWSIRFSRFSRFWPLWTYMLVSTIVWLWSIQPDLPAHCIKWWEVRFKKEASGRIALENGSSDRTRVSNHTRSWEDRGSCADGVFFMRGHVSNRNLFLHHGVPWWADFWRRLDPGRNGRRQEWNVRGRSVMCLNQSL